MINKSMTRINNKNRIKTNKIKISNMMTENSRTKDKK